MKNFVSTAGVANVADYADSQQHHSVYRLGSDPVGVGMHKEKACHAADEADAMTQNPKPWNPENGPVASYEASRRTPTPSHLTTGAIFRKQIYLFLAMAQDVSPSL